jgi:hypothetical protein
MANYDKHQWFLLFLKLIINQLSMVRLFYEDNPLAVVSLLLTHARNRMGVSLPSDRVSPLHALAAQTSASLLLLLPGGDAAATVFLFLLFLLLHLVLLQRPSALFSDGNFGDLAQQHAGHWPMSVLHYWQQCVYIE